MRVVYHQLAPHQPPDEATTTMVKAPILVKPEMHHNLFIARPI